MTPIPAPDDTAHHDTVLMAEVTEVNTLLGRYVLRFLDADARRTAPLSTTDERVLARRVAAIAEGLHARADRRERHSQPPALVPPALVGQHSPEADDARHIN